jgi:hypothetical protein
LSKQLMQEPSPPMGINANWYRGILAAHSNPVTLKYELERYGILDRQAYVTDFKYLVDSHMTLKGDLALQQIGGKIGQEAGLGIDYQIQPWKAESRLALAALDGEAQWPFATVALGWEREDWGKVRTEFESKRWLLTNTTAIKQGRENAVTLRGSKKVLNNTLELKTSIGASQYNLKDQTEPGYGLNGSAGVTYKPLGETSPWGIAYDYRAQNWGTAATAAGLPLGVDFHSVTGVYQSGWQDKLQVEVYPGITYEARTNRVAPVVSARVDYEPVPEANVSLTAGVSPEALAQGAGVGIGYQTVGVGVNYKF